MRKALLARLAISACALALWGCGVAEDFEASSRLVITSITGADGEATVVANAHEVTDDSGTDGQPDTDDPDGTENNGRPDAGETIVTPLQSDMGTISFKNEPRGGEETNVDLNVYQVDITYFDANGQSRTFAPTKSYGMSLLVPAGGTADLTDVILVPMDMKAGVRAIVLFPPSAAALSAVSQWTAVVDVYARDDKNDDEVHAQGKIGIVFVRPM